MRLKTPQIESSSSLKEIPGAGVYWGWNGKQFAAFSKADIDNRQSFITGIMPDEQIHFKACA
jgi:hypothetical protein